MFRHLPKHTANIVGIQQVAIVGGQTAVNYVGTAEWRNIALWLVVGQTADNWVETADSRMEKDSSLDGGKSVCLEVISWINYMFGEGDLLCLHD